MNVRGLVHSRLSKVFGNYLIRGKSNQSQCYFMTQRGPGSMRVAGGVARAAGHVWVGSMWGKDEKNQYVL